MRDDFCVFILTHGRPNRVHTYKTLQKAGYTGKVYIVIDDEDSTAGEYQKLYGDKVLQFCKREYAEKVDEGDNSGKRISTIYARAAMFDLAPKVGCRYFVQLDDDYLSFSFRHAVENGMFWGISRAINKSIDDVFDTFVWFIENTKQVTTVAMAQAGDFIGGSVKGTKLTLRRKAMNSFFCDTKRPWQCAGRMNEDVSAYVIGNLRGSLFFTMTQVMLCQQQTQQNAGGMSELYLDSGTYVKSFYTVMHSPACVQIGMMGDHRVKRYRIHHQINWHKTAPKIIRETHRKVCQSKIPE